MTAECGERFEHCGVFGFAGCVQEVPEETGHFVGAMSSSFCGFFLFFEISRQSLYAPMTFRTMAAISATKLIRVIGSIVASRK